MTLRWHSKTRTPSHDSPRILQIFAHPAILALSCVVVPLAHWLIHRFGGWTFVPKSSEPNDLCAGILTAAGFLASMAGVFIVFLISDRGTVFRGVRKAYNGFFVSQMVCLFALPASTMVITLLAQWFINSDVAMWGLEYATLLLSLSIIYDFLALYICANAAKEQDRQDDGYERLNRIHQAPH